MIRCNNCGTNNIDGSEYCDECGMRLDIGPQASNRARNQGEPAANWPPSAVESDPADSAKPGAVDGPAPSPPSFTTSTVMPKPATPARDPMKSDRRTGERPAGGRDAVPPPQFDITASRTSSRNNSGAHRLQDSPPDAAPPPGTSQTFLLSSRGRTEALRSEQPDRPNPESVRDMKPSDNPRITARLVIERGGRIGKEFPVTGIETNIGRWDADSGIFPDVDLDEDDPEAKISRRHARIVIQSGQYYIEDLGSTNGTFVNRGRRLLPGKRHTLQSGDEIIVGKTFLKFQILR